MNQTMKPTEVAEIQLNKSLEDSIETRSIATQGIPLSETACLNRPPEKTAVLGRRRQVRSKKWWFSFFLRTPERFFQLPGHSLVLFPGLKTLKNGHSYVSAAERYLHQSKESAIGYRSLEKNL